MNRSIRQTSCCKRWFQQLAKTMTMKKTNNTMRVPSRRRGGSGCIALSQLQQQLQREQQQQQRQQYLCRAFCSTDSNNNNNKEWRKHQLDKLERKFDHDNNSYSNVPNNIALVSKSIDHEEDLQPMWQQMERRVKHRTPRTLEERGGSAGRQNIKKTDEDMWLQAGLYQNDNDDHDDDDDDDHDNTTNNSVRR